MRKGAQIVLDCLRAEGVDLAFGYPGGAIMPLYDALEGSGIRHVLTRHEQGAVFAAEGLRARHGKSGRGHRDQRSGRHQPGHWHRRRQDGFGSSGLHYRPSALAADWHRRLSGNRRLWHDAFTHQVEPSGAHD